MRVFLYFALLILSLVLASFAWSYLASGRLYYCSDSVGPFDFIPPFIHPRTNDHYIAPAGVVWSLWFALVLLVFVVPAIVLGAASRVSNGIKQEEHPK